MAALARTSRRAALRRGGVGLIAALGGLIGTTLSSAAVGQEPPAERQSLTGDWNGMRPLLSANGFEPHLTYTGSMWSNLAGGRDTGAQVNGYLDFGVQVDLAKLGAWDGLGFRADFHWWQGPRPTDKLIGGLLSLALSDWEAAATFRVYDLYIRQAVGDDRLVVKLGQIAADSDFMISRYGGIFLNAAFGDLPSQNLNIDAPVYPLAAPGVFAAARPWTWLTGRFGAYTGDAGDDVSSNHGFGWGLGNNAGYTFFSELAATPPDGILPATYMFGAIYDTGGSAQFGSGAERNAHYELYLMVDQALIANDHGDPVLGAFAHLAGSPQDAQNVVSLDGAAGFALFGPLSSRPQDVLGIAVEVLRFTNDFQQQERAAGTPVGGGETVLEVTYQVAITPWLVVQPDAQFFFNPAVSRRDAQSLGGQLLAIF